MQNFTIHQPLINDARYDEINAVGWGGTDWDAQYLNVTNLWGDDGVAGKVRAAVEADLYAKSYDVLAEDVTDTFEATNGFPSDRAKIVARHGTPKSGSVGDVVIATDGGAWVCLSFGWAELPDDVAALFA